MILLVASQFDQQAFRLARNWAGRDACLLTAKDLSRAGWSFSPSVPGEWRGIAGDRMFDTGTLTGVLNCLPEVDEHELSHINAEDRAYVAAEMNAFLLSWQSQLSCPVINRPSPNCLLGPAWSMEKWVLTASALGIPALRTNRCSGKQRQPRVDDMQDARTVTVVGDFVVSENAEQGAWAQALARAAGATVATFHFNSSAIPEFVGVGLRADLENPTVADALLRCFEDSPAC